MKLNVIDKPLGLVLYEGPSLLDNKPVVVVATGLQKGSGNTKTGSLIQTWILLKNMTPTEGVSKDKDYSICGDCKHREWDTCYVNVAQGPYSVYGAYKRDRYTKATTDAHYDVFNDRLVRLGAYGDPAAVPTDIWAKICKRTKGHTGYTHQWKTCDQKLKNYCMASVDTEKEFKQARKKNWRTFRVRTAEQPLLDKEFVCPASKEEGYRLKCEDCLACDGGKYNGKGTVAIVVHGISYKGKRFGDNIGSV
jgi:hypothetical protein